MKKGIMFLWKKKLYLVERYFSELEWVWDVVISYEDSCVVVRGDDSINVLGCLNVIEFLYMKGGLL